jgi:large subunit ribosomal protein L16
MLKQPKQTKFKKFKKTYLKNCLETRAFTLHNGFIGLKATSSLRITARQIEALRQCMSRELKRRGKIWLNLFPYIPVSSKPTENRMGKGKGSIDYWCAPVKVGSILVEISGVPLFKARQALLKGRNKLPIKTRIVLK